MKLQTNNHGAWKDVIEFDAVDADVIAALATAMYHMSDKRGRFRLTANGRSAWATMDESGTWSREIWPGDDDGTH